MGQNADVMQSDICDPPNITCPATEDSVPLGSSLLEQLVEIDDEQQNNGEQQENTADDYMADVERLTDVVLNTLENGEVLMLLNV